MDDASFSELIHELRSSGFPYNFSNKVPLWFLSLADGEEFLVEFNRVLILAFLERQFDDNLLEQPETELLAELLHYKATVQARMEFEFVQRESIQVTIEPFDIFSADPIRLTVAGHRWNEKLNPQFKSPKTAT